MAVQTDEDTLQLMYEYEVLKGLDNQEYVVKGAQVFCGWGGKTCTLNLPYSHGKVTADNRPFITHKDSGKQNVSGFGTCNVTGKTKTCQPDLSDWSYIKADSERIYNYNNYRYEYAVTRGSTATCKKGGGVAFETSGQVVADYKDIGGAIDIIENKEDSYENKNDKDLLGHIKVTKLGVYSLGIYFSDKTNYDGGTIFLYKKKSRRSSKLEYIGAYELVEHNGINLEGFQGTEIIINVTKDGYAGGSQVKTFYWTMWVTMLLEKDEDYYVEIDCPNINSYNYKLICRQPYDRKTLAKEVNELMCNIHTFMSDADNAVERIYQAIDEAIKINGAVAIGISGSVGGGLYLSGSAQIIMDLHGEVGLQISIGTGGETGGSADVTIYVALYPGLEDLSVLEGFGTEIGGSIGELLIGSFSALTSGEGNDTEFVGFLIGAGVGGELTFAEGHIAISNTFPTVRLGNIYTVGWDVMFSNWNSIYSAWNTLYSDFLVR